MEQRYDRFGKPVGLIWPDPPSTPAVPAPVRAKTKRTSRYSPGSRTGAGGSSPVYSRSRIISLYTSGKTVPEIAEELGCNKQTVYTHLKAAGVKQRDDRKNLLGPPRRTHCVKRNHEFTPENTRTDGRGNRSCKACAAIRSIK